MKLTRPRNKPGWLASILLAVLLMAAPSFAAEYNLTADATTLTMPDSTVITVWGFADADAGGVVTVPGPMLEVLPGDTTLTIHLTNNLPVPVSIVIPGQASALSPVVDGGRVTSFTGTVAAGDTGSYTWTGMRPGTYIYHSGADPALQVHMGLYGGVKVVPALGEAYPGVPYDAELVLFYSEIDPALHDPAPLQAQPLRYDPAYFLVNGQPYPDTPALNTVSANQRVLIRLLNAGLKNHVPALQNGWWTVVAEDGNPYPYPREQYSALLPAMKTLDVIWVPEAAETYAVYDRMHHLTNAGVSGGGMLVNLTVGWGSTPAVNILSPLDGASFVLGETVAFSGTAMDAEDGDLSGTLSWTSSIDGNIGTGGSFSTSALAPGMHMITASVTDSGGLPGSATIMLTIEDVNDPPVAVDDYATTTRNTTAFVYLTENDYDPDGAIDPDSIVIVTQPTRGGTVEVVSNGVVFTPRKNFLGTDVFSYTVRDDDGATSNTATVRVNVVRN
ncbi:Ig-like domain-containing protein [Desulfatiglans anilini]|uniref:Ig-like domain-containing protein n=1 Tax=Desulfatiglans anilini TaxID=90728 RepID=UPI000400E3B0|nr:Ig-like domain-containing protein [Desulfatiglans anilini]